jgi:hypothetical protein
MQYWTKNGSIPSTETDGTEGWQQAPAPPTEVPADKEVVWLNWEWIIRDPKPQDRAVYQWNWNHADRAWVESQWGNVEVVSFEDQAEPTFLPEVFTSSQVSVMTTAQLL